MAGYGSEVWCETEIVAGRMAFGATAVSQALVRRLTTPRGSLFFLIDANAAGKEESSYGLDVSAYVGQVGIVRAVAALPSAVEGECLKDDRVSQVKATAIAGRTSEGEDLITLTVEGALADSDETFAFVLGITEVTAELIRGEAA